MTLSEALELRNLLDQAVFLYGGSTTDDAYVHLVSALAIVTKYIEKVSGE
jgi:hypothetical protein